MKRLVLLGFLALSTCSNNTPAFSHSWYPADCCSDRDCWPTGEDADAKEPEVKVVPGGYVTHDGHFVAEKDTRPSKDGRFHVCRYSGVRENGLISTSKGICLFVPQPTF